VDAEAAEVGGQPQAQADKTVQWQRGLTFAAVIVFVATAKAASTELEFDVASVKVNQKAEGPSQISGPTPGRFVASNTPLRFIVLYAYGLLDHQLIGAPEWMWSTSIDVAATYPSGTIPTDQDVRIMVRNLLRDRFGFMAHKEQREMPTYSLTLARKDGRLGPQIRRSDVDCVKWIADKRPSVDAGGASSVAPSGKRPACGMIATRKLLVGGTRTMLQLAVTLQGALGLGRPVFDRTGLTGAYDIDLQWTPDGGDGDAPSIFTALQEQLGLKLTPEKDQVEVLVIDKVERPALN
jgi:uncharacterized protein (TIGR03435 family)